MTREVRFNLHLFHPLYTCRESSMVSNVASIPDHQDRSIHKSRHPTLIGTPSSNLSHPHPSTLLSHINHCPYTEPSYTTKMLRLIHRLRVLSFSCVKSYWVREEAIIRPGVSLLPFLSILYVL